MNFLLRLSGNAATNRDAATNGIANPNSNADCVTNSERNPNCIAIPDAAADADPDSNPNRYPHPNSSGHSKRNGCTPSDRIPRNRNVHHFR